METQRFIKFLLVVIAIMLSVNFLYAVVGSKNAAAIKGSEDIGRYQISSWATDNDRDTSLNGYYILDTATGRIVESKGQAHRSER